MKLTLVALVCGIALGACNGDTEPEPSTSLAGGTNAAASTTITDTTAVSTVPATQTAADSTMTDTSPASTTQPVVTSTTRQLPTTTVSEPQSFPLDLEETHPNGTVVALNRVEFAERSVTIDVTVFNGSQIDIEMATAGVPDSIWLTFGDSGPFLFQAPEENSMLRIPSASELVASLGFVGQIPADAESFTLAFNTHGVIGDSPGTATPQVLFEDIPIP